MVLEDCCSNEWTGESFFFLRSLKMTMEHSLYLVKEAESAHTKKYLLLQKLVLALWIPNGLHVFLNAPNILGY